MADKKRRDKGDGCISQRADGTWTARIRVGLTPEGKPKIKAFYGKSEREVKKKLKEFEKELHKNDMSVVQKGTVESYMLNWLRSVKFAHHQRVPFLKDFQKPQKLGTLHRLPCERLFHDLLTAVFLQGGNLIFQTVSISALSRS